MEKWAKDRNSLVSLLAQIFMRKEKWIPECSRPPLRKFPSRLAEKERERVSNETQSPQFFPADFFTGSAGLRSKAQVLHGDFSLRSPTIRRPMELFFPPNLVNSTKISPFITGQHFLVTTSRHFHYTYTSCRTHSNSRPVRGFFAVFWWSVDEVGVTPCSHLFTSLLSAVSFIHEPGPRNHLSWHGDVSWHNDVRCAARHALSFLTTLFSQPFLWPSMSDVRRLVVLSLVRHSSRRHDNTLEIGLFTATS